MEAWLSIDQWLGGNPGLGDTQVEALRAIASASVIADSNVIVAAWQECDRVVVQASQLLKGAALQSFASEVLHVSWVTETPNCHRDASLARSRPACPIPRAVPGSGFVSA